MIVSLSDVFNTSSAGGLATRRLKPYITLQTSDEETQIKIDLKFIIRYFVKLFINYPTVCAKHKYYRDLLKNNIIKRHIIREDLRLQGNFCQIIQNV